MIGMMRVGRYGVVSAICMLLSITLVPLFSLWGLHYALAAFASFWLVAATGFLLHCLCTFEAAPTFTGFVRYVSAMALNLPLSIILIGIGHDMIGASIFVSTTVASLTLTAWNFVAVRWAVRDRTARNHAAVHGD